MNLLLEEYIPYRLLALFVLAVFYGFYLVKQWRQKRRGIQTMQIGRGKDTQTHTVETLDGARRKILCKRFSTKSRISHNPCA